MTDISIPGQTPQGTQRLDPNLGLNTIQSTMDKFLSAAGTQAVYGTPISQGETIVIPAAEVLSIAGFGLGAGSGGSLEGADPEDRGSGTGGGGGGHILSRPVAAIVISPAGVRVEPIVDVTKIGLALLTTLGVMVGMLTRTKRDRHKNHHVR